MTQPSKRPAARRRPVAAPLTPRHAAARKGPIDAALDADLFKALGDPTRLQLLACLAKCARPCSVSEVADCCHVDLSVVSRHLALLQRAGANTGQTAEKHGVPAPGSKIVFLNQSAELVGATQRLCHISRE